jgi:hypothetical protein
MLPSDVRGLYAAYNKVYAPKFETILDELSDEHVEELTDDLIEEIVQEVFYECLEEGYDIDEVENVLVESLQTSLSLLNEVSDSYYDDAVKTGKAKAAKAKRAETIEKVKGAVKKVGDTIKQKAAGAAVSAYAAGKMAKDAAKPAVKAAGKAVLKGAGKVAGKATKYAKKAGEAVSAGYKEGSDDNESETKSSSKAFPTKEKPASGESGEKESGGSSEKSGSIRKAAGSLLKKAVKKVVGKAARAVAGTARGVHGLADKAAKRLGEETTKQIDEQGGPALPGEPGRPGTPKAPGGRPHLPGEKQTPTPKKSGTTLQLAHYEYDENEIYDVVMEYLLSTGHADTILEANYIMTEMDVDMIVDIVEDSAKLAASARRRAEEMGRKRRSTKEYKQGGNRGTGRNERAAYNLSNAQRSAAANPELQTTRSRKPAHYDSGMHQGDYDRYNRKDPKKNPKHDANR